MTPDLGDPETRAFVTAVVRARREGRPVVRSLVRDGFLTPDDAVLDATNPLTRRVFSLDDD